MAPWVCVRSEWSHGIDCSYNFRHFATVLGLCDSFRLIAITLDWLLNFWCKYLLFLMDSISSMAHPYFLYTKFASILASGSCIFILASILASGSYTCQWLTSFCYSTTIQHFIYHLLISAVMYDVCLPIKCQTLPPAVKNRGYFAIY